mmetsp:Transcript_17291/g.45089  ORF Transcript_17291/g.45089 Transcript_17291/m.45089 type:complete len:409 (-) Transcript_17291:66-1292(-)
MAAAAEAPEALVWLKACEGDAKYGPFNLKQGFGKHAGRVLLECGPKGGGNGHLRVGERGAIKLQGGMGKWAQFMMVPDLDLSAERPAFAEPVTLFSFGNIEKGWCLGSVDGELRGTMQAANPRTRFLLEPVEPGLPWVAPLLVPAALDFDETVELTPVQLGSFAEDGFLHVPAAVDPPLVAAAMTAINRALTKPGSVEIDDDGSTKFCPGLGADPAILNLLYRSKVWTIAQRLLGRGKVQRIRHAQIALRGPQEGVHRPDRAAGALPPSSWHIDGMGKNKHSPFSVLVGVSLSPQEVVDAGNFCVFPGSHRTLLPLLKEQVAAGSPLFSQESALDPEKPRFDNGVQVLASPGDAVFAHQKLAHRGGPNTSPNIRYQVYFRLSHVDHAKHRESGALLDDLWVEFDGVRR